MIGVLGGMGPLATAHFYQALVEETAATSDQTHVPVIIWGDPSTPDRTAALLGCGPSPVPAMQRGLDVLVGAGATTLVIPCNTAHAFIPDLRVPVQIEFIDMIRVTVAEVRGMNIGPRRVGVLATRGTRVAGIYEKELDAVGLSVVSVLEDEQAGLVDEAIRIVKGGGARELAERLIGSAAAALRARGADVLIAGCTEIPLIASAARRVIPVVDSTRVLARHCATTRSSVPTAHLLL